VRFCSLGSGSTGNAWLVEAGASRVLIDCGLGVEQLGKRLARTGVVPEQVNALLITHEHDDHVGGAAGFARRYRIPVYATYGTQQAAGEALAGLDSALRREVAPSVRLQIGDLEVLPVAVPHDAREPVQFVIGDGAVRVGVITDLGSITAHVIDAFSGLDALVLEANHDSDMLEQGPYPRFLKDRVGGRFGHLSNEASAQLLGAVAHRGLQHVVAAHLSLKNNTPELARAALSAALGCDPEWIGVARANGFEWRDLR
jgi:phosphoribosyl 1,2-cyclic phosphodiesterase